MYKSAWTKIKSKKDKKIHLNLVEKIPVEI